MELLELKSKQHTSYHVFVDRYEDLVSLLERNDGGLNYSLNHREMSGHFQGGHEEAKNT